MSVRASKTSVALELIQGGGQSASDAIQLTLESAPGSVFPRVRASGSAAPFLSTSVSILSDTVAQLNIFVSQNSVSAGNFNGTVLLDVCEDAACGKVLASFSYAVSLRVHAPLSLGVGSIAASTPEGVPTTIDLTLTAPALAGRIEILTRPTYLVPGTLSAGPVVFTVDPTGMAPGSYGGDLQLMFIGDNGLSSTLSLPVSLNLTAGLSVPADLRWALNVGTLASALSATVDVQRADGVASSWSAASNVDWLVVTSANTTMPARIGLSVDTASIDALANDTAHTATVTVSAPGLANAAFHVVLDKRLPAVGVVTPTRPAQAGAQTYTLAGRGFGQLTQVQQQVRFAGGSITPLSIQVVSDTLITADLPALAPGRYAVDVATASGLTGRAAAALLVADPAATLPTGFFPFGGVKHLVLHDPSRNAIYAINRFGNQFLRYTVQSGTLVQTTGGFGQPLNAAVAPDGWLYAQTLGVGFAAGDLLVIDPDSWQVNQRVVGASFNQQKRVGGLSTTADGRLWLLGGSAYWDLTDRTVHQGGTPAFKETAASLDGKVMLGIDPFNPASPRAQRYNYLDGTVSPFNTVPDFLDPQLDRDGSHMLLDSTVYNSNSLALGRLAPTAANESPVKARLSPDGTRVYALMIGPFATDQILRLDVFDTSQIIPGTDQLLKLRSIALPVGAVSSCNQVGAPNGCQPYGDATVTADGRYYIVAADLGLLVVDISEPAATPAHSTGRKLNQRPAWLAPSVRK